MGSRFFNLGVLTSFAIISFGMFIYNNAQSAIVDSMYTMSTQEIQAFNNQFVSYEGEQSGSNLKAMIGTLIANANTYQDEPEKVPGIRFDKVNNSNNAGKGDVEVLVTDDFSKEEYMDKLIEIKNSVENKNKYWVTIVFQSNGLIDGLVVTYDAEALGKDADTSSMHILENEN